MHSNINQEDFSIRPATKDDVATILQFIKGLADYEHMLDQVVTTEESLEEILFHQHKAEVIIGSYQQKPIGFALFFHNFSTFLGKSGLYIEDLFVSPEMRGMGFGKALLSYLANLSIQRNCGRMEWSCLDWNKPSIAFYQQLGARPMDQWTIYRLEGEDLANLAN